MEIKSKKNKLILQGIFDRRNADLALDKMKSSKVPEPQINWKEKVNIHNLRTQI